MEHADQYLHGMQVSEKELKTDIGFIQQQLMSTTEVHPTEPYFVDLSAMDLRHD